VPSKPSKARKARRPRKPPTPEQLKKREKRAFSRRIQTVFKNAGFAHLPTEGKERKFGKKTGELDNVFVYENVILVCEDTLAAPDNARDHLKNKKLLFDEIKQGRAEFIQWLQADFPEQFASFDSYPKNRYKVFFLYFPKFGMSLDDDDLELFEPVKVVQPSTLNYFHKMASNIRLSSRSDIFRYLELTSKDVGAASSGAAAKMIETSIIYPDENTGLQNGVKLVSFMLSAETLLKNSYVLRKDNWQDSIQLYQRLIERNRIQDIRKYLAKKKTTFINNIIVSLPDGTTFEDAHGDVIALDDVEHFQAHKMRIPDELNSICVIDGQHRIFAHYEGTDALEAEIAKLRGKFHLLVTGLIFPSNMEPLDRRKFESGIFLDINSEAKQVPPDVLLFIETLTDPFSDLGISRQVLDRMNRTGAFKGLFQLSLMEESRIKTASIIKFALRYLVAISENPSSTSLFAYWEDDKKRARLVEERSEKLLADYVNWCATQLNTYFGAVKSKYGSEWANKDSKILSTTSVNGFIIALRRSLPTYGVQDFAGYSDHMKSLSVDFSSAKFGFASSQYAMFSRVILDQAFALEERSDGDWAKRAPAKLNR
jgi:DGQHR domain-containing protein